ncbi:acyl carrier protein [Sphingomonas abietis]|uniref:Acyl carrier protein n=1 Tax=Sphingomonas abietis TaxID=3012344 RepID=A0ABY7NXK4_9SPHN|nr:acyl carrier protein [Sphingomonas abietis]WBO24111.1 acyl carrier protein [Sphingomonas abietis]
MSEPIPTIEDRLRAILRDVLGLSEARAAAIDADTPLFGAMPELDSMAVAGLLTEIEDRLHILIEDDEIGGEMLESFGGLTAFVRAKQGT